MSNRPASIVDIAKASGVSHATVSYVLNRREGRTISKETTERVLKTAKDLGYRPNAAARSLRYGRTNMVLIWTLQLRQPIYAMAVDAIEQEALRRGYMVLIGESDAARAAELPKASERWPVDGILAYDRPIHVRTYAEAPGPKRPIVSLGPEVYRGADYVKIDLYSGCKQAMEHLIDIGCRRILMLNSDVPGETGPERLNAYTDVMRAAGLQLEILNDLPLGRDELREPLAAYLDEKGIPDSMFCWSDGRAIAASCILYDLGIRVPEQVALVGLDDIDEAKYRRPSLSTVASPLEEACKMAWDFLVNRIENPDCPHQTAILSSRLVIRQSTTGFKAEKR
ncbi:MAG: LacI family DNA-binding transcriptional regulator [Capsulimonadaceae bacterium]|nr:LacI family DNA-binding transcriptional regulator [Capsulimonadaceae bacterium]